MIYCGIDNGTSGSICLMDEKGEVLRMKKTPSKKVEDYNQTKKTMISRIDVEKLCEELFGVDIVLLERPFKNPCMFKASISSVRANEATVIVLEKMGISYEFIDSKAWQHKYFPKKEKGVKQDLKELSKVIGENMIKWKKDKQFWKGDYDSFFIAKYLVESKK